MRSTNYVFIQISFFSVFLPITPIKLISWRSQIAHSEDGGGRFQFVKKGPLFCSPSVHFPSNFEASKNQPSCQNKKLFSGKSGLDPQVMQQHHPNMIGWVQSIIVSHLKIMRNNYASHHQKLLHICKNQYDISPPFSTE